MKRFGLLKKGELGFNFLATGLFVKCLKPYVMAYAPIARQSMCTKEIDRDLMFYRNKMPNYKQTESSQTHCTNPWFFPDKYCPVFDKRIGKILNFKNLFAHVNSTNFCSIFGRNRQIGWLVLAQRRVLISSFFPLYLYNLSFCSHPQFCWNWDISPQFHGLYI